MRRLCLLMLLAGSTAAKAQTSAMVMDARVVTERDGSKPDTQFVHSITSGRKIRVESRTTAESAGFPFDQSGTQLIIFTDSGMTMIHLDSATKTFMEFDPVGMMKGVSKMMESMGGGLNFKSSSDSTKIDSLGAGETILGYPTLHFRTHSGMTVSFRVFGDSQSVTTTYINDVYVAPALKGIARDDSLSSMDLDEKLGASISAAMPGMDQVMNQAELALRRLAKIGPALKNVREMSTLMGGLAVKQRSTTEILVYRRMVVPDSIFTIPAGYKKVEPIFPGILAPDSGSRTLRSPRTPF